MAENDIYNSQARYERYKSQIDSLCQQTKTGQKRIYVCKNPENLAHFKRLIRVFDIRDQSYVRRIRLMLVMKIVCSGTTKNLKDCDRDDIDDIVALMHTRLKSSKSKRDFILDLKFIWKMLFAELDEMGRKDDSVSPYCVRHLTSKTDKSREKRRNDKLTWPEYENLVTYFSHDKRMQAYVSLAVESLARPQELLYLKIRDVEHHESYARVSISEHGKEGIGWLQCIDSYPYLLRWLEVHPLAKNPDAFLFMSNDNKNYGDNLRPESITKKLKTACQRLDINKKVTAYSLKRNGVTFRRLRGESDLEIMHAARWTSTKQLQTYDLSEQNDAFRIALAKRGLIKDETLTHNFTSKECWFCHQSQAFANSICSNCKRPLDKEKISDAIRANEKSKEFEHLAYDPQLMDVLRRIAANPSLLEKIARN